MTRTRRELIDLVLDNLGVLVPGRPLDDEAISLIDVTIDPVLVAFNIDADAGTPDPPAGGKIEEELFRSLGDWLAWHVARNSGVDADSEAGSTIDMARRHRIPADVVAMATAAEQAITEALRARKAR